MHRDPDAIAARLVALLPCRTSSDAAPLKTLIGVGKRARSWAVIYMMLMVLALGTEWIVASRQPSGQVDRSSYTGFRKISPQVPPSSGP